MATFWSPATKSCGQGFSPVRVSAVLAVVGVPKSLPKRFEDSTSITQTFWSPTTKASDKEAFPAVVGVPKSLLKRFEDSTSITQTFWSPTTKASDKEAF